MDAPDRPTAAYCRTCRVERRFRFAGWAADGGENTVRPRAVLRTCSTCGRRVLALADVTDAESLVATVIDEWERATARDVSSLDRGDLTGMLLERIWLLYLDWRPGYGDGRITFRNYATGLLRRKLRGWVDGAAGGVRPHRNGHGRETLRYPKAHSLAVSESYDVIADDARGDDGRPIPGRLAFALGTVERDFADDRCPDLGGVLLGGDR